MNTVKFYNNYSVVASVDDNFLRNGTVEKSIGLIGESLDIDTFTFYAYSEYELHPILFLVDSNGKALKTSEGKYILVKGKQDTDPTQSATIGQPITLSYTDKNSNTINLGEFFVQDIEAVSKALYKFTCQTVYGILDTMTDVGGLYTGSTNAVDTATYIFNKGLFFGDSAFDITVDAGVDDTIPLLGWLPYGTAKENLMHILFALGYIIIWNGTGWLLTTPARRSSTIADSMLQVGGTLKRVDRATYVELTEHTFFESPLDKEVTLFDNTSEVRPATGSTIVFDQPCHDLDTTGSLVIDGSHDNYAVVSGLGTLTGLQYSHSQRILTDVTNATSERTARVENETLVNMLNSKNVLQRLVNLQNSLQEANLEFFPDVTDATRLGDAATFTDVFGNTQSGVVTDVSFDLSGKLKYKAKLSVGFISGPYGQNIQNYKEFSGGIGSQTWTIPADIDEITIVLGQAGSGGNGGYKGGDGADGTTGYRDQATYGNGGAPGAGGNGGEGGSAGKVYTAVVSVTPGTTLTVNLGEGGTAGSGNHGSGGAGGHATITYNGTTYTSNDGTIPPNGYYNPLSGNIYSLPGPSGDAGYSGGTIHWDEEILAQGYGAGQNGESEFGTTPTAYYYRYGLGGGGGGGTYSEQYSAASDGGNGYYEYVSRDEEWWSYGGDGGDGADAKGKTGRGILGSGGAGGDGGGGGGGGGGCRLRYYDEGDSVNGRGGTGGNGGAGQQGGRAYAIVFY